MVDMLLIIVGFSLGMSCCRMLESLKNTPTPAPCPEQSLVRGLMKSLKVGQSAELHIAVSRYIDDDDDGGCEDDAPSDTPNFPVHLRN